MASPGNDLIVVAIDFGTTFSGYAYSFKSDYKTDPRKISANAWGRKTDNLQSLKTPTCILLKCNTSLHGFEEVAFGYDAEDQYVALVDEDEHHGYVLANRFKMDLYSESAKSGLKEYSAVQLANGNHILAMRLYSMFIGYIRDHFFKTIGGRGICIKESDIRWVLTVPAIWTEGAKQLMRKAADQADISPDQLTIAYEPEAAALYCMHVPDPTNEATKMILEVGCKYLVVDAGGGTVDFTVCEVSDTKRLDVHHEATGGPWGGTNVDEAFLQTLVAIFGQDVVEKFRVEHREELSGLMRDFEYKKRSIRDDQKHVTLRFPIALIQIYEELHDLKIVNVISQKYGDKFKLVRDKLRFSTEMFQHFFNKTVENITDHIKAILRRQRRIEIDAILLVGGFGGSAILQQRIRDSFPDILLIIPEEPEMAVVKGAVLYGHDPAVVKTRVARYSYGISSTANFKQGMHPADKRKMIEGRPLCTDIFSSHLTRGQVLHAGETEPARKYYPVHSSQTSIRFKIFASSDECPEFVTEDSCTYIGELVIDMPDTTEGRNRPVMVELSFGETEILVKAIEESTNRNVSARLEFTG